MLIPTLVQGDEIVIGANAGYPDSKNARTEVILSVSGFSAITNEGTLLSCDDDQLITKTGKHFEWGEYHLGDEARAVLYELGLRVDMTSGEIVPE